MSLRCYSLIKKEPGSTLARRTLLASFAALVVLNGPTRTLLKVFEFLVTLWNLYSKPRFLIDCKNFLFGSYFEKEPTWM